MSPGIRKLALATHVIVSVGWLGAVGAFLALAIAGLAGRDALQMRAAYLAAGAITWTVIVPLCLATLVTGIIVSLATPWGLVRHYWVIVKLVATCVSTGLLFLHTKPIGLLARGAAEASFGPGELHGLRLQLVGDATAALVALAGMTLLSIYKPAGMTRRGWIARVA